MIVSFSVSNFRSFSSEQTLSLVASNRIAGDHDAHLIPIPDSSEHLLPTAVLYGANGAGKSNLFNALKYLQSVALEPRPKNSGTGRVAFRLGVPENDSSTFDLQFVANSKLYRFGVKVDDQRITEEWLVRISGNRETVLYERTTDMDGNVAIEPEGLNGAGPKLQALAMVGGPQNQSFLATIDATLETQDLGEDVADVLNWLHNSLILIGPDTSLQAPGHLLGGDPGLRKFVGEFLRSSSTGVEGLDVLKERVSEEDLRSLMPAAEWAQLLEGVRKNGTATGVLAYGTEIFAEQEGDRIQFYRVAVQAAHTHQSGHSVAVELDDESDGTRRLLHLIPALYLTPGINTVYFIDEIDRSLHPMLVKAFVASFLKSCSGGQRQIIVSTHESNLLDQELLRRDEIWFAEKDQSSATRLYSLMDFEIRKHDIRKHYLEGRFGAVPFFGDLNALPLAPVNLDEPRQS